VIVDLFAGGGGASVGIEAAMGRPVDVAVDHDPVALAVHRGNHPRTLHLEADIWDVRPLDVTGGTPVDLLWASPSCTHFSTAKGQVPLDRSIRSLAWVVVRWAKQVRPSVVVVENVSEFSKWGPLVADGRPDKSREGETFRRWVRQLERLGYVVDWRLLDASEYGAPTKRRRIFIVARCDGEPISWPAPTHGPGLDPLRTAADCIDWSLSCPSIFERKRPLAEKTLWRIAQGVKRFVLEAADPFIVYVNHGRLQGRVASIRCPMATVTTHSSNALVSAFISRFYGGSRAPVGSHADRPLPTITAWDHNALAAVCLAKFRGTDPSQPASASVEDPIPTISAGGVHVAEVCAFLSRYGADADQLSLVDVGEVAYQIVDIGLRMLEPHELLAAQFGRFADAYDLAPARTKAAKVRLIGNSVAPEVAEAVVRANTTRRSP